jgi:Radical SAM superfamily
MTEQSREGSGLVGLVLCPCFAFGSPPLALASLQAVLRRDGFETVPYDLDFMLMREDPATFQELYALYNIGHPDELDRVQFVLRPMLILMALHPERFSAADKADYAADLAVVARVERFLDGWAARMHAAGVRVVMCSVYVSTLLGSLLLAKALKAIDPSSRIAFGGPGVGMPEIQEFVLRLGWVDVCATGEGEPIAPPLADALLGGRLPRSVPGVCFLDGDVVVRNPAAPLIPLADLLTPEFAGLPIPGRSLDYYRCNPNVNTRWFGTVLPIATTRGCVMRCTFCSETNYWQKFRHREPADVLAEIRELQARWGISQFLFCDSLLNGDAAWLEAFADGCIAEQLDVRFVFAYFRPTRLPRATLEKLALAGFQLMSFGLETGSQELLSSLAKGTKVSEAEQIVVDALDLGISVNVSILCGFPGETAEHLLESVRFLQRVRDRTTALGANREQALTVHAGSVLRVEPYSRMYQQPERSGLELHPQAPRLPPELEGLEAALAPLMVRWTCSVEPDEMRSRARFLLDALNREPVTVFLNEPLDPWIDDTTVVLPVNGACVLSDSEGRRFLVAGGRVLAGMDEVASQAWEHIARGESFGAIKRALVAELPETPDLEHKLRKVFVGLLTNRYVYVEDFGRPLGERVGAEQG